MNEGVMHCPACRAELVDESVCWLCKHRLTESELGRQRNVSEADPGEASFQANPFAPPPTIADTSQSSYFSVVLIMGMFLVLAGLIAVAPGFGILLAIITTPALIRTSVVVAKRRQRGKVVSVGERSLLFLASVSAVVTACVAAGAAFAITCAATCFGLLALEASGASGRGVEGLFPLALMLAGLIGISSGGYTLYRFWRRKHADAS